MQLTGMAIEWKQAVQLLLTRHRLLRASISSSHLSTWHSTFRLSAPKLPPAVRFRPPASEPRHEAPFQKESTLKHRSGSPELCNIMPSPEDIFTGVSGGAPLIPGITSASKFVPPAHRYAVSIMPEF